MGNVGIQTPPTALEFTEISLNGTNLGARVANGDADGGGIKPSSQSPSSSVCALVVTTRLSRNK